MSSHFSWFELLPGFEQTAHFLDDVGGMAPESDHTSHHEGADHHQAAVHASPQAVGGATAIYASWLVSFMLIAMALIARAGLRKARARGGTLQFVPGDGLGLRNLFEIYTQSTYNMGVSVLSRKDSRTWYWLIGGLFIYILFGNLLSIIPGFLPPTDNFNNNLAMGLTVFIAFNIAGVARNGFGYIKHMMGPVWWLAPLILVIELIGVAVRPLSLSLRLMGNIYGDHMVFGVMSDLVPVVIPSIFLGLGIFVSFLQAFVFTLLTIIYLSLSVGEDEGHH